MPYETLGQQNASEGLHVLFVYANEVTGGVFINMMLFALLIITCIGSFTAQKRLTGEGNLAMSFAVAAYFVFGATLILSLIPGMVNIFSLLGALSVSVLGTAWLYLSNSGD